MSIESDIIIVPLRAQYSEFLCILVRNVIEVFGAIVCTLWPAMSLVLVCQLLFSVQCTAAIAGSYCFQQWELISDQGLFNTKV